MADNDFCAIYVYWRALSTSAEIVASMSEERAGSVLHEEQETFPVSVLLFASLRDVAGERIEIEVPRGATVQTLLKCSAHAVPSIAAWIPHIRVAVNCEYASASQVVSAEDEIAFLPPVSGGATSTGEFDRTPVFVDVVEETIRVEELIAWAQDALQGGAGAVVPFIGVVRNNARGKRVNHLEYQAYPAMAKRELEAVARETAAGWKVSCAIVHRVGKLQIGEASIVIAVASPHRAAAFEACRFAIDRVKETVPIWKKEIAEDGSWWVEDPLVETATNAT